MTPLEEQSATPTMIHTADQDTSMEPIALKLFPLQTEWRELSLEDSAEEEAAMICLLRNSDSLSPDSPMWMPDSSSLRDKAGMEQMHAVSSTESESMLQ